MNLIGSVSLPILSVPKWVLTCLSSQGLRRPRTKLLWGNGGIERERAQESRGEGSN